MLGQVERSCSSIGGWVGVSDNPFASWSVWWFCQRSRLCGINLNLPILFVTIWSPGTSDLTMRFGLHSGPVTAGVLRGAKSRFQLFGDTVNTGKEIHRRCYLLHKLDFLWCIFSLTASLWVFLASFNQLHVWNRMDWKIEFMYHNRPQINWFLPARVVGWHHEKTRLVPKEKGSCKRIGFLRNFLQVMVGRCQIVVAASFVNHQLPPLALMRLMIPPELLHSTEVQFASPSYHHHLRRSIELRRFQRLPSLQAIEVKNSISLELFSYAIWITHYTVKASKPKWHSRLSKACSSC